MNRNDELMHYGVLGMKWGQRRARVNASKASQARKKGDAAAAKKYGDKAKEIEARHISRAGGKKAYNYTKNQSTGKALAKSMLMGTYGTTRYNRARSQGKGRVESAARAVGAETVNTLTKGGFGVVQPRMNEIRKRRANKKQAKQTYKTAKNQAYDRYGRSIDNIEKNYKRGQQLSDKDYAREQQAEDRYSREIAAAKAQYKKDKRKRPY